MRMGFEGPNEIVPTAPAGDSSNRAANTAFVTAAVTALVSGGIVTSVIASTGLGQTNTTGIVTLFTNLPATSASLGADVSLTSVTTYFDGPSVAQGTTGTWFACGTVTLNDAAGAAAIFCKLWDGVTVIASTEQRITAAADVKSASLSGFITSPAGNIRISCEDVTSASGKILFNVTGLSKDSTISAFRIA